MPCCHGYMRKVNDFWMIDSSVSKTTWSQMSVVKRFGSGKRTSNVSTVAEYGFLGCHDWDAMNAVIRWKPVRNYNSLVDTRYEKRLIDRDLIFLLDNIENWFHRLFTNTSTGGNVLNELVREDDCRAMNIGRCIIFFPVGLSLQSAAD